MLGARRHEGQLLPPLPWVEDFRTQLLTHWAEDGARQVEAISAAVDDPVRRLRVLLGPASHCRTRPRRRSCLVAT
ncbi:MAG: hypothetical protein R2713_00265 [Ilumatobacteraceae bacterium]